MMREGLTRLLTAVAEHRPDVAVVDIRMPPTRTHEGLRTALELRDLYPGTGVLVFSQYIKTRSTSQLLAGSAAGVGYLLRDRVAGVAEFADSLARVAAGGTALDPGGRQPDAGCQAGGRGRAHLPRARGAVPDGAGTVQRRYRRGARPVHRRRREARCQHLRQAGPAAL